MINDRKLYNSMKGPTTKSCSIKNLSSYWANNTVFRNLGSEWHWVNWRVVIRSACCVSIPIVAHATYTLGQKIKMARTCSHYGRNSLRGTCMSRCSFLTASLMDFWYLNNHDGKSEEDAGQDTGPPVTTNQLRGWWAPRRERPKEIRDIVTRNSSNLFKMSKIPTQLSECEIIFENASYFTSGCHRLRVCPITSQRFSSARRVSARFRILHK